MEKIINLAQDIGVPMVQRRQNLSTYEFRKISTFSFILILKYRLHFFPSGRKSAAFFDGEKTD